MKFRLEVVVGNVLSGEDNAFRKQNDTVVDFSGGVTGDQSFVGNDFAVADARDGDGFAGFDFVTGSQISAEVAAQSALDTAVPQTPAGQGAGFQVSGHTGRGAEAGDGDIFGFQALVFGSGALARKSSGVVADDEVDIRKR